VSNREALNPKHPELTALTQSVGKYARYIAWFAAERALTATPVTEPPIPSIRECLRTFDLRGHTASRVRSKPWSRSSRTRTGLSATRSRGMNQRSFARSDVREQRARSLRPLNPMRSRRRWRRCMRRIIRCQRTKAIRSSTR
jgi:hypothetical protein